MSTFPVVFLLLYNGIILLGAFARPRQSKKEFAVLAGLFFCSGIPALIYQIVWQRSLFAVYGVNSESVAVVVSAFMIGLGVGSLAGGWLSQKFPRQALLFFGLAELGAALFGIFSLGLFHWVASHTSGAPLAYVLPLSLGLLLFPTMCMGATLPLLTDHLVRSLCPVGYSVGLLYFSNTFGSSVACYLCATFLLRDFGQSGSVRIAAAVNLLVGLLVFWLLRDKHRVLPVPSSAGAVAVQESTAFPLSLSWAIALAAITGFIALGFEIAWFRVFVLVSSDRAPAFALLLSTYLAGVAAGSYIAGKLTENSPSHEIVFGMSTLILVAGGVSPYLTPLVAWLKASGLNFLVAAPAFFVTSALFGAIFPLICKLAIPANVSAGRGVSLIYVANITGSAAGSLLIGFVLLQRFRLVQVSSILGWLTVCTGFGLLALNRSSGSFKLRRLLVTFAPIVALFVSPFFFSYKFESLALGSLPETERTLAYIVENRNGVIAVAKNGAVFGNNVYDGFFNVDPLIDKNLIVRAFAVGAFHPSPARILMIGLSSGSWAQVLVNHPKVESLEIVEINPGYFKLIPEYPAVRSLLENPKVHIHVDDGRRWLLAHPDARYDVIVQNTSFFWRDHTSDLLSADYLRIIREHLDHGGIFYYNTTGSDDVIATGLSVFPYGLRVLNFLALSDSPITIDKKRWSVLLRQYRIDDRLVFDPTDGQYSAVLDKYMNLADSVFRSQIPEGLENTNSMRARIRNPLIITDDNMGWEWRGDIAVQ